MAPRLIVIGGGYIGTAVARRLDAEMDVTLIEPREAMVHTPAMIRALVHPELTGRAILPYDRLLRRGRVIRDRALRVGTDGVALAGGATANADLILVATGSSHAAFLKPRGDSLDDFRDSQADTAARIAKARHIAIAGAGPVGIELAGEIAAALPGKPVTLVSSTARLMPGFPQRLGRMLDARLAGMGVTVIQGRAILPRQDCPLTGPLLLEDGRRIDADLVLPATGAHARSDIFGDAPLAHDGRIVTDPWLQISDKAPIFAAGDVAATGDAMTIVATMRQVPYLVHVLRAAARGRDIQRLRPYRPWPCAPILLPLGPRHGASFLPLPGPLRPLGVVGGLATRQLKGADLFIPKYRRAFGLA
ncbi:FAD-dependent oxidoreductase [uncultured Paracoccus sp.]|uniref:NAD(P)/FAD-dependent oxidoreductase n=1 Tax=uncultured Paracoccus sp. TaxID=189685 RepID=UPI0025E54D2F|nr:FAD-dependent oxidoreductase [uncultured Paracoccus sp.]